MFSFELVGMFHRLARFSLQRSVFLSVLIVVGASSFGGCRAEASPELYRQSQFLLDTLVEIIVVASNTSDAENAMSQAFAEIQRLETILSRYRSDSQIFAVNRHAGDAQGVRVDREVSDLIRRSLRYADITNGAFDMTIGAVVDLWGIGTDHQRVPESSELQRVLPFVNPQDVEVDADSRVRLRVPEVKIDLGGIGKGYCVDRAVAILRQQQHISGGLVNAGGNIRCFGTKPDGTAWRIGIQHPRDSEKLLGTLELREAAVATSGDYERYFMQGDTRYHHIFVPQTGLPARECQSVTIVTDSAERADVFSTAVFVMGPERGMKFLEEQSDVEAMIVRSDGTRVTSSGFVFQPMN